MTKIYVPHIERCPRGCGAYITPSEWNPQTKRCKYCPPSSTSIADPGVTYSSQKEYRRAKDLQALLAAGKITNLRFHTTYPLLIKSVQVGRYVDDFSYIDLEHGGIHVIEDVKSPDVRKTQGYQRSKRLMKELYNIVIVEL